MVLVLTRVSFGSPKPLDAALLIPGTAALVQAKEAPDVALVGV